MIPCACGCGTLIEPFDNRGRPRKGVFGHGNKGKSNVWKTKPESRKTRTGRYRARRLHDCSRCEVGHIGGCSGRVEVHHIDGNPLNNESGNRIALCTSHHSLVEKKRIDLADPIMPAFVVRGGKRRYLYRYSAMDRSEACRLREQRKREARI